MKYHLTQELEAKLKKLVARGLRTIVIDLDGTILFRNFRESLNLYFLGGRNSGRLMPDAVRVLTSLSERYNIVGVTARWFLYEMATARFMEQSGLGFIPVVHSRRPFVGDRPRGAFKLETIEMFRDLGLDPFIGIGDRPSDFRAYLGADLQIAMVTHNPDGKRWRKVCSTAGGKDFLKIIGTEHSSAWTQIQQLDI
ncbi:MAG: hypothetical protein NUW37_02010 [Planctomycetes bacterium]|nr:hypothetical protein [Planctomycetota bacterium]